MADTSIEFRLEDGSSDKNDRKQMPSPQGQQNDPRLTSRSSSEWQASRIESLTKQLVDSFGKTSIEFKKSAEHLSEVPRLTYTPSGSGLGDKTFDWNEYFQKNNEIFEPRYIPEPKEKIEFNQPRIEFNDTPKIEFEKPQDVEAFSGFDRQGRGLDDAAFSFTPRGGSPTGSGGSPTGGSGGGPPTGVGLPTPAGSPPPTGSGIIAAAAGIGMAAVAARLVYDAFVALVAVSRRVYEDLEKLADQLAPFNQQLIFSKAMSHVLMLEADMRNAQRLGPGLAEFTNIQTEMRVAMKDAAGMFLEPVIPIINEGLSYLADIAVIAKAIARYSPEPETVSWFMGILRQFAPAVGGLPALLAHISDIADVIRMYDKPEQSQILNDLENFLDPVQFAADFQPGPRGIPPRMGGP